MQVFLLQRSGSCLISSYPFAWEVKEPEVASAAGLCRLFGLIYEFIWSVADACCRVCGRRFLQVAVFLVSEPV